MSGSQSDLYGLYSDSVYLTGHIKANSGSIGGINMASSKLYTGTGTFNHSNTGIYLDSSSNFSLGNKLAWNNSTLAIDGTVTIGGTTASVVVSGAASGSTANQDSTGDIQAGTTADNVGLGNVDNSNFASDGDIEGGEVGGWTINSDAIFTGTKDTSGYTSTNGHITISSSGSIHTPKFYVNSDGTAGFKGTVTIGSTNFCLLYTSPSPRDS